MAGQGCDLAHRFLLPVVAGVPEVDLVETVAVGGDHFVGDLGEEKVANLRAGVDAMTLGEGLSGEEANVAVGRASA